MYWRNKPKFVILIGINFTGLSNHTVLYSHLKENGIHAPPLLHAIKAEQGTKMQNGKILLVEDNEDDEILTLRALKANGIENEVFVVRDGAEALDFLFCTKTYANRDSYDMPQLILLDIKLPKIDGLEVLRRIRAKKRTSLLPVVLLTSSNEERDLIEGYKSGANSCLRKPVDHTQFVQFVGQLGLYWLGLNEAPPQIKDGYSRFQ